MRKAIYRFLILILFYTFPLLLLSSEKTEGISIKSAVIFNTLCSKCHEGECSGRLSFNTGSKTAGSHIRRYTEENNLSKDKIKEFFALLNHMKKACAIYMPDTEKWGNGNLSHFILPSAKGYFIPLGVLKKGKYTMKIKAKEDTHFQIEILSEHFEHFLNQEICPEKRNNVLQFTIERSTTAFLRIKSRNRLHIISLEITRKQE